MAITETEVVQGIGSDYEVKYGFRHPPPFWRLTPRRAFAWTDLGKDATRWLLPSSF